MNLKLNISKYFVKSLICLAIAVFAVLNFQPAFATDLPPGIVEYVKKTFPGSNIRFDGLIELSDGTLYLPVIPVVYAEHEGPVRVTMSIPQDSKVPELMIFSNNLSLLKIITNDKGEKTILSGTQVPLKVKLGLLPQDMVVPEGLIIPPDMNSIVGDLVISSSTHDAPPIVTKTASPKQNNVEVKPDTTTDNDVTFKPLKPLPEAKNVNPEARLPGLNSNSMFGLNDRLLYVTNITGNKVYVVDPHLSQVVKTIQVAPLPYGAVLSPDKKHLYVTCMAGNSVASINLATGLVDNIIKVGKRPVSIAISPDGSKLFVTNSGSGDISVISTELFEIVNTLKVQGMPEGIVASNDNRSFYIFNRSSGIVSKWDALDFENRQFLFMLKNPYAIAVGPEEKRIYVTSRTLNNLMVYNLIEKKYETVVNVGKKPVDILVSPDGKIVYTLDAGDDKISVIDTDTFEPVGSIDLMTGGFPSNLTKVPNENKVLVTNAESDKITLVDLDRMSVITTIPIGVTSKTLVVGPTPNELLQQPKKQNQEEQASQTVE